MFAPTRWRLVASTLVVLGLVLALAGAAVYVAAAQRMRLEVDRDLALAGAALVADAPEAAPALLPVSHHGYHGGRFFLVADAAGQVLANPQQVALETVPPAPPGADSRYRDLRAGGEPLRLYVVPTAERAVGISSAPAPGGLEGSPGALQYVVGQSLTQMQDDLRRLLAGLVAGGALGLTLSVFGAWLLAGMALVPIEGAFKRQQEFVADASHELRAPLTVLRAATDLLDRRRDQPLAANGVLFDDLRRELARLERLAGDLLTLARSDRGELELQVAPLDLSILAADVVRRTTPLAEEKGVSLLAESGGKPVTVEADPDRLQQVLLVLLDNALKHTPQGGQISVGTGRRGAEAVITVRDSGEGIAPEHLPRLFDRFYRADRARAGGGAGLGLAIARSLVGAHGGRLEVSSTLGQGTLVTLRLPLAEESSSLGSRVGRLASRVASYGAVGSTGASSARRP